MRAVCPMMRLAPVALVLTAACAGAKGKAEAAITTADQAIAAIAPDAGKVLPFEVQQLTDAVTAARDTLAKGDFAAALAAAAEIPARAQDVAAKAPAKREQLTAELDTLGFAMSKNLAAIQTKLDEFAKTKRLPKGLDAATLETVKATQASATQEWPQIKAEIEAGDLASAFGKGTVLRLKVSESLMAVGLVAGDPAWHNLTLPPK